MKKHFCDECGKEIKKMWYAINSHKIIGITGKVESCKLTRSSISDNLISSIDSEVEFEVCSKKCMLHYLRKKVLK